MRNNKNVFLSYVRSEFPIDNILTGQTKENNNICKTECIYNK